MSGGSAFNSTGRYDERDAIAHDQERFAINESEAAIGRLLVEIHDLRAALRAIADAPRMHDVYQTADQFADLRLLARKALGQ